MVSIIAPAPPKVAIAVLVVNKHLGADSLQGWITTTLRLTTTRLASSSGYRILGVARS